MTQLLVLCLVPLCLLLLAIAAGQHLRLRRYEGEMAQAQARHNRLVAQHRTLQALYADRTRDLLAINSRIVLDYHRTRRNT